MEEEKINNNQNNNKKPVQSSATSSVADFAKEQMRLAQEKIAAAKAKKEQEKLAAEKAEKEKQEQEKLVAKKAEQEKLAAERAEQKKKEKEAAEKTTTEKITTRQVQQSAPAKPAEKIKFSQRAIPVLPEKGAPKPTEQPKNSTGAVFSRFAEPAGAREPIRTFDPAKTYEPQKPMTEKIDETLNVGLNASASNLTKQPTAAESSYTQALGQVPIVKKYVDMGNDRQTAAQSAPQAIKPTESNKASPLLKNTKSNSKPYKKPLRQRFSFKVFMLFATIAVAGIGYLIANKILNTVSARPTGFTFTINNQLQTEYVSESGSEFWVEINFKNKYRGPGEIKVSTNDMIATLTDEPGCLTTYINAGQSVKVVPTFIGNQPHGGIFVLTAEHVQSNVIDKIEILIDKPVSQLRISDIAISGSGEFYVGRTASSVANIIPQGGASEAPASSLKRTIEWELGERIGGIDRFGQIPGQPTGVKYGYQYANINNAGEIIALQATPNSTTLRLRGKTKANYGDPMPLIESNIIYLNITDVPPSSATFVWNKNITTEVFIGTPGATYLDDNAANSVKVRASQIVSRFSSSTGYDATYLRNTDRFLLEERVEYGNQPRLNIVSAMESGEQVFYIYAVSPQILLTSYQEVRVDVYLIDNSFNKRTLDSYNGTYDTCYMPFAIRRVTEVSFTQNTTHFDMHLEYFSYKNVNYYTEIDIISHFFGDKAQEGAYSIYHDTTKHSGHDYSDLDLFIVGEGAINYQIIENRKYAYFKPTGIGQYNFTMQLKNDYEVLASFPFTITVHSIGINVATSPSPVINLSLAAGEVNRGNDALAFINTITTQTNIANYLNANPAYNNYFITDPTGALLWNDISIVGKLIYDKAGDTTYLSGANAAAKLKFNYSAGILASDPTGTIADSNIYITGDTMLFPRRSAGSTEISVSILHNYSGVYADLSPYNTTGPVPIPLGSFIINITMIP